MLNIEDMLEVVTVKDVTDESGYSYGWYYNRVPVYGYKLRAKKGSFLERLEIFAKSKFKLENDPENYVQEARLMLWLAIDKYYSSCNASEDDEDAKKWIYTYVKNGLQMLARELKGGTVYYDREKGEYIINQIDYFQHSVASEELLEEYLNNVGESMMNSSKNAFMQWFEDNKYDILTKKQIAYIDNDEQGLLITEKNKYTMHKNIVKRIDKAYHDNSINENKIKKIENKLEILNDLLDCTDLNIFKNMIINITRYESGCGDFIIDELYEELKMSSCKKLTSLINGNVYLSKDMYYEILDILIKLETKINKLLNL